MVRDEKIEEIDMERVDIGITELPGRGEQIAFFEKLLEAKLTHDQGCDHAAAHSIGAA
jgi:hypothetical protein